MVSEESWQNAECREPCDPWLAATAYINSSSVGPRFFSMLLLLPLLRIAEESWQSRDDSRLLISYSHMGAPKMLSPSPLQLPPSPLSLQAPLLSLQTLSPCKVSLVASIFWSAGSLPARSFSPCKSACSPSPPSVRFLSPGR